MKNIMLLLSIFISVAVAAQQFGTMYVAAKSGLSIREKPEIGAKVLDKIPYGTKITLIEYGEEKKSIVTEGITGFWGKVKYNNKTGYIVDSYLFPWAPPKLATVKEMKDYLAQVTAPYGAKLITKSGTMGNIAESGWEIRKQLYKNGAERHEHYGWEYGSNAYFLPGFSMQQGFLLLRLIPEYKEVFGDKDEFPSETKKYKKGESEYELTVSKRSFGEDYTWVEKIRIEYGMEASYVFEMYMLDNQLVIFYGSGL